MPQEFAPFIQELALMVCFRLNLQKKLILRRVFLILMVVKLKLVETDSAVWVVLRGTF